MQALHKIGKLTGDSETPYIHPKSYLRETVAGGVNRIVAGLSGDIIDTIVDLTLSQPEPFFILYVLHTPRGEGDAGRYQSPSMETSELRSFLSSYSDFLSADSRFDLWIHSPNSGTTIVWERHNLLYTYGSLDDFEKVLVENKFSIGRPSISSPHVHYYHSEFDLAAKSILKDIDWGYAALQPEDEQ